MPLPTPKKGEARNDFVSRCMSDPTAKSEFPDNDQRVAVCERQYDDKDKKKSASALAVLEDVLSDGPQRWHATGFTGGGVRSVDPGKFAIRGAQMVKRGEALGHGFWVDKTFVKQVQDSLAAYPDSGLKCRFGHPGMCDDALGTFLGRWKQQEPSAIEAYRGGHPVTKSEEDDGPEEALGDLFLSSSAAESPKGDLRKYVLSLAQSDPAAFGASIVFTFDRTGMRDHMAANSPKKEDGTPDFDRFRSPDPDNKRHLPHARMKMLHAADLVDSPAATKGLFSGATGPALAGQMSEWLQTHPAVFSALNESPEMVEILTRHAAELAPFLERYNALRDRKEQTHMSTTQIETELKAEADAQANVQADAAAELKAKQDAEKLAADAAVQAKADAEAAALKAAEDKRIAELQALKDQVAALTKANEALLKGETPAGSKPGQTGTGQEDKRTAWQKCQKPARK